jgi:hypothetical protein
MSSLAEWHPLGRFKGNLTSSLKWRTLNGDKERSGVGLKMGTETLSSSMPGQTNFIGSTIDMEGQLRKGSTKVGDAFTRYFQHLFATEGVTGIEDCILVVCSRVKPEFNAMLSGAFSFEEINSTLAQM